MRAAHVWVRMDESKNDRETPPTTPPKATPSLSASTDQPMSLSSPELLKELKQPLTLKHVHKRNGWTKIFSGKGRPIKQNTLCTDSEDLENRAKPAQWQSAGALSLAVWDVCQSYAPPLYQCGRVLSLWAALVIIRVFIWDVSVQDLKTSVTFPIAQLIFE